MTPAGQSAVPPLTILLLGPPVVNRNGVMVKINRRELRAGLYFLAGHVDPVSRAEICDTFWPDESEEVARKKLREGLSRLRSALNDPHLFITNNDFVSLDASRVFVDAREYTNIVNPLLNSSELNGTGILPEWMYIQLRKAMELCRGHRFLQDSSLHNSSGFDAWVSINDQTYSFTQEKIIERLAEHCIAVGNIDEAIVWLGKITAFDHLNTDINFLMVNCLRERRKFKEALDYLTFLDQVYQSNHPAGMPEVLKEAKKRIMRESFETKISKSSDWPGENTNNVPFVGRGELLSQLNHAYHRKGIVHVSGESGSGKTRLVKEFYSRLESSPRLLFCIGKPMISSTPYSPIVDGLNRMVSDKEWLTLPDEIKTSLHSLYPQLKFSEKRLSPIIIEKLPDHPVVRIHNALYSLLKTLAEKKPLLMVIDIAEWCDDATLQFLSFLNEKQFFRHFGLLIIISRTEKLNPALETYLNQSILASHLERITLPPFSLEETAQFISADLGKVVSDDLVTKIQNQTGGNPYLLIETLKVIDLYNLDVASYSVTDHYPIPATIRAIANEKIRVLSDSARDVLMSAAILGHRFNPQVLEKMVQMEYEQLLNALEELTQSGIISTSGPQETPWYEFPHDQFRAVVVAEMAPVRKRGLHLASVRAMLEIKGEAAELASTFAWHYEQAGETIKAFSAWCAAGKYSRHCYSRDDAYASYQHALNLLHDLPVKETSQLLRDLMLEWGDYAYDLYDVITCEKLFKTGLEFGEDRQDPLLIGVSISGLGRVAEMRNEVDEGIELHQRALFFLSKTDSKAEKLETYARLGILYELKDDYQLAKETFLTGLTVENDFSDMRILDASVNLKSQLSILYSMMGYPAQAELIADQAANESKLINRVSGRVHAHTALAIAQFYGGKYRKSLQNAFSVYKLAEHLNLDWWVSLLDIAIARDYLVLGHLDESWIHIHHAVNDKDPRLLHKIINYHHVIKGDILRLLGDYSSAEDQYRQGAHPPYNDLQSLENYFTLGLTFCQRGEIEEGLRVLKEAIEYAKAKDLESISLFGRLMLMGWENPGIDAERYIQETAPYVSELLQRGFVTGEIAASFLAGEISLQQMDLVKAREFFIKVVEASRRINHRWYELWALSELSRMMNSDKSEAAHIIEQKTQIMEEMAAHAKKKPMSILMRKNLKRL